MFRKNDCTINSYIFGHADLKFCYTQFYGSKKVYALLKIAANLHLRVYIDFDSNERQVELNSKVAIIVN